MDIPRRSAGSGIAPAEQLPGRWIRTFGPAYATESGARVLCFPHAGGAASAFTRLAAALRGRAEVAAVQYPGRQDRLRETPLDSIVALAEAVTAAVDDGDRRRHVLLGHSMGALVAYEVALRLQQRGTDLAGLFVSACPAPSTVRDDIPPYEDENALVEHLIQLGATQPEILHDPELRALVLPAIRSDYRAVANYRRAHPPPVSAPISVLVGDGDGGVSRASVEGWRAAAARGCAVHVYPGGHFYLYQQADAVAELVAAACGGT